MNKIEPTYQEQSTANQNVFEQILKDTRPEIHLLMQTLDQTGVNPFIVWRIIMAMSNLAEDTRYGNVVIEVEDNTVRFVRGQHSTKVNEPIIKRRDDIEKGAVR